MNYIGMDIHKQFTVAVAKDKEGNKLAEEKCSKRYRSSS